MSHAFLLVLVRPEQGTSDGTIDAEIERLMEPYNWNKPVESYEKDCYMCEGLEIPNPTCEECGGSGKWTTTCNPKGEWDWWQRGGRFTGALVTDYNPEDDPANKEPCPFCTGPDRRYDRAECPQCQGTGIRTKWPTSWRLFDRDVLPVPSIRPEVVPFGVLTPDGEWQDAESSTEKGISWERRYRATLETYSDCLAVVVDFHI